MNIFLRVAILLPVFFASVACASYADLPESAQKVLDDGKLAVTVRMTWQEFHDKYATKTSGEAERADRETKWNALDVYSKQFWIIQKSLKVGEQINDYPGILAHGTLRWDSETKSYDLTLGLRPYNAGDGLGQFTVTFDLKGVISGVRVHKYKW
jgi:hypothetical protein